MNFAVRERKDFFARRPFVAIGCIAPVHARGESTPCGDALTVRRHPVGTSLG